MHLKIKAYAKINLSLDILGLRPDGYHELRSLMQSVSLADELLMQPAPELSLAIDNSDLSGGEDNIVIKCLRQLQRETGTDKGAEVALRKIIPLAAGLAGGSADGAAALAGANQLWGLDMSLEELSCAGARVGSDIPFCLRGGAAVVGGRGELLEPLAPLDFWLLLVKPPVSIATAWAYHAFDAAGAPSGQGTERLLSCWRKRDLQGIAGALANDLLPVARAAYPEIGCILDDIAGAGALGASMSGSGPTCFGIMPDRERAISGCHLLAEKYQVYLCRAVRQGIEVIKEDVK